MAIFNSALVDLQGTISLGNITSTEADEYITFPQAKKMAGLPTNDLTDGRLDPKFHYLFRPIVYDWRKTTTKHQGRMPYIACRIVFREGDDDKPQKYTVDWDICWFPSQELTIPTNRVNSNVFDVCVPLTFRAHPSELPGFLLIAGPLTVERISDKKLLSIRFAIKRLTTGGNGTSDALKGLYIKSYDFMIDALFACVLRLCPIFRQIYSVKDSKSCIVHFQFMIAFLAMKDDKEGNPLTLMLRKPLLIKVALHDLLPPKKLSALSEEIYLERSVFRKYMINVETVLINAYNDAVDDSKDELESYDGIAYQLSDIARIRELEFPWIHVDINFPKGKKSPSLPLVIAKPKPTILTC